MLGALTQGEPAAVMSEQGESVHVVRVRVHRLVGFIDADLVFAVGVIAIACDHRHR